MQHILAMSGKIQCWCENCGGSKNLIRRTIDMHVRRDQNNGIYTAWQEQFVATDYLNKEEDFTKRTPIGKFMMDATDPRKKRLHDNTRVTIIEFLVRLVNFHAVSGLSIEDSNNLLELFRDVLGNASTNIPANFDEVKRNVKDLTVRHTTYIFCKNNHHNIVNNEIPPSRCSTCKAEINGKASEEPAQKYLHLPIIPRLKQLFDIPTIARALQTIPTRPIHDSVMWQEGSDDPRELVLSYCSDGFNPYHHIVKKGSYSIWAQTCDILNLPLPVSKNIPKLLLGLIPGPKMDIDMKFITAIMVEEFMQLKGGVVAFDAYRKQSFTLNARVGMFILDIPGAAKELGHMQQNAIMACPRCNTEGCYSSVLGKTIYCDSRRFLDMDDPMRVETCFPNNGTETRPPPRPRDMNRENQISRVLEEMTTENNNNPRARLGTSIKSLARATGRATGSPWQKLKLDINVDCLPVEPMHMLKGIASTIMKLINGQDINAKVLAAECEIGRFQQNTAKRRRLSDDGSSRIHDFTLTQSEKSQADYRLNQIAFPDFFGDIPKSMFTKIEGKTKSHTWMQVMTTGVLGYCIRGLLNSRQQETLSNLCYNLSLLFNRPEIAGELEKSWHVALAKVERDFPMSIQTINFHIAHHLPYYIQRFGTVKSFWMYDFERYNQTLVDAIRSKSLPEKSAMHVIEYQWLTSIMACCGIGTVKQNKPVNKCGKPVSTEIKDKLKHLTSQEDLYEFKMVHTTRDNSNYTYRGAFTAKAPSMVTLKERGDLFCGQVVRLFATPTQTVIIGEVEWKGVVRKCQRSKCFFVEKSRLIMNNYIDLLRLSRPVPYARDGDILWLLTTFGADH